jgi:hypothetical protein
MQTTASGDYHYISATSLTGDIVDFDGLQVRSTASNEVLGTVEGFIVDRRSGQLRFVVVDSGGWFGSESFLLPPGRTRLAPEEGLLWTDATRESVRSFPGFDTTEYPRLSENDLWQIERRVIAAYGDDAATIAPAADWDRDVWSRYSQPDWWQPTYGRPLGLGGVEPGDTFAPGQVRRATPPSGPEGERAQPGDVLGIERGGETTSLGKTGDDEDREREAAEKEFGEMRERDAREAVAKTRR